MERARGRRIVRIINLFITIIITLLLKISYYLDTESKEESVII